MINISYHRYTSVYQVIVSMVAASAFLLIYFVVNRSFVFNRDHVTKLSQPSSAVKQISQ